MKNQLAPMLPMIKQAFKQLNAENIATAQNFSCCGTCARSELKEKLSTDKNSKKNYIGYVFWHNQAHDSAKRTGELSLSHQPFVQDDDLSEKTYNNLCQKVADAIYDALFDSGLCVLWNGDPFNTITVMTKEQGKQKATEIDNKITQALSNKTDEDFLPKSYPGLLYDLTQREMLELFFTCAYAKDARNEMKDRMKFVYKFANQIRKQDQRRMKKLMADTRRMLDRLNKKVSQKTS